MIELYTWPTPNGHKIHIMLEECELPYAVHAVDIGSGAQFEPDFLKISPNNRIPAIVDPDGPDGAPMPVFESGAILLYLAGKTGRFLPDSTRGRYEVLQWLMWQMGGFGPMLGQNHHFRRYAKERIDYAVDRYTKEAARLYGVLERRLAEQQRQQDRDDPCVCGDYSIADMAIYPWTRSWQDQGLDMRQLPLVSAWRERIEQRPAVQRALQVLANARRPLDDDKARDALFGATQFAKR